MKLKLNLEKQYIFFASIVLFFFIFVSYTSISGNIKEILSTLYSAVWAAFRIFILLKVILQFNLKSIVPILVFLFIIYDFTVCGNSEIYMMIWFILGIKKVDLNKLFKSLFFTLCINIVFINSLCLLGVLPDKIMYRKGIVRHTLGFSHPNAYAMLVYDAILMYIYLRGKSGNMKTSGIAFVGIVTYIITRSNTELIALCIVLCVFLLGKFFNAYSMEQFFMILKKLKILFYFISLCMVIAFIINFDQVVQIVTEYTTGTLYTRMLQLRIYFQYYGMSLLGQNIKVNFDTGMNDLYTLDNGYMYLFLGYGIIIFVMFILSYLKIMQKMIKYKNYTGLLVIFVVLIYGLSETMLLKIGLNFTLFFMGALLWNQWSFLEQWSVYSTGDI